MLSHRLRRCPNIEAILSERLVLAGNADDPLVARAVKIMLMTGLVYQCKLLIYCLNSYTQIFR